MAFTCDGVECNADIYVRYADTVTVTCSGPRTTETTQGCYYVDIYATDVTTSVDLTVSGNDGFYYSNLYADNAGSVTLDLNGDNSNNGFSAKQAGSMDITCYAGFDGQDDEYNGCYLSSFYVPDTITSTNFKLTCYGKGCRYMDVYSTNGFSSATSDNFVFNGCDNCVAGVLDPGLFYFLSKTRK